MQEERLKVTCTIRNRHIRAFILALRVKLGHAGLGGVGCQAKLALIKCGLREVAINMKMC